MRADQQIEVPVSLDQWPENPVFWPTRGSRPCCLEPRRRFPRISAFFSGLRGHSLFLSRGARPRAAAAGIFRRRFTRSLALICTNLSVLSQRARGAPPLLTKSVPAPNAHLTRVIVCSFCVACASAQLGGSCGISRCLSPRPSPGDACGLSIALPGRFRFFPAPARAFSSDASRCQSQRPSTSSSTRWQTFTAKSSSSRTNA